MSKYKHKRFKDFIEEASSYDEQDPAPTTSVAKNDFETKEKIRSVGFTAEELIRVLSDGEQLEPSQVKLVNDIYNNMNTLRLQIQGRIKTKEDAEQARQEEQSSN